MPDSAKPYLDVFQSIARRASSALKGTEIEVHAGWWLNSTVLKLQKPGWTDAKPAAAPSGAGVFFSVWIEETSLKNHRVLYNIHALRLRNLPGYSLQSREFASAFRAKFSGMSTGWPNISVDHGPQTLMQGWIALNPASLEKDISALVRRFVPLAPVIDELLLQRSD